MRYVMTVNALRNFEDPNVVARLSEIATKDPKTIGADELAATAVAIMEDYNITGLVITDDGNTPVGIIHLHDLLKAKVV